MEGSKRARVELKSYSDRRSYVIPKKSKGSESAGINSHRKKEPVNALIFDNGAHTIKIGYSKQQLPTLLPNHIMKAKSERKRCFIADQIDECRDLSGLFYIIPHEHGYITKFDVQKTIWDYTFTKFPIDESPVIMTQPIMNYRTVQDYMDEIFYEEYDVKSLYRANATDLSQYLYTNKFKGNASSCVVVDSGYSFSHIVPYINGKKYTNGIIRLDIGGKLLTNYLKDILSYRQLHVMEETYVINHLKEDSCFMADDFKKAMSRAKTTNEIVKSYVLPDFHNIRRGFIQNELNSNLAENCQILRINNERFSVPEVIMRPSNIPGMEQAGLAECIAKSINKCPSQFRNALSNNVVLTGGNCLFKGFKDRVMNDTRIYLPCHYDLSIFQSEEPINFAWQGGRYLSSDASVLKNLLVTKQDYEEHGSNYTYKTFNNFSNIEEEMEKKPEIKVFSYLEHWKKENVDIFQKSQMVYEPKESDVKFILEGDGIDEMDGKYVTLEFEYEDAKQEQSPPVKVDVVPDSTPPPLKLFKKKKIQKPEPVPPLTFIKPETHIVNVPNAPSVSSIIPTVSTVTTLQTVQSLPTMQTVHTVPQTITKLVPKIYKPIFRQRIGPDSKTTQIISLGTPVSLGNSIVIPNRGNVKTVTINSTQILNNTVILPSNMINSKNLTLQIIPLRSDMLRTGTTSNFIIAKKP